MVDSFDEDAEPDEDALVWKRVYLSVEETMKAEDDAEEAKRNHRASL